MFQLFQDYLFPVLHLEALITVHILNAYIFFIYEYFLTKLSASAIDSISNNIVEKKIHRSKIFAISGQF